MTTKTEQLRANIDAVNLTCTMEHVVRKGDEWEVANSQTFDANDLPAPIRDHLLAYGIKGFLGDRCSQFRSHGIISTLDAMGDVWALLEKGMLSAPRKTTAKGIDRALVHLVAEKKDLTLAGAEAALKKITKETRDAIANNPEHATRLAEIRLELASASTVDLGDLS